MNFRIHLFKKNNVQTPLLKCSTRDPDVIRHIYQNSRTVENWRDCHRTEWSLVNGTLDKLKFTVVTIAEEDGKSADSTLQLAWTFFNAINSGGKQLSDYDLLKAHHLRYLSKTNNDALIHYKAAKWDADGKEAKKSFGIGNSKAQIYEALLAHTVYPIRSWLRNRRVQVYEQPADEKYCVLKHYSALLSFQCSEGSMTELSSGVIGGKEFFDWTEYWVWQYRRFCENPIIMRFNSVPWKSAQFHLRVIARAILFYYFCKFGDVYLADACVFILYRIGRLRNGTARRKDSWYGNREDERCVPHTIIALDESPTPEYFFKYCQLPSNRYVRYYDLKTSTKDDPLLNSWRHGPDWWKNLLGFVSSGQDKNPDGKAISIPLLENARIGNSVCYKKEIADLLNDVANDFGREFDKETLLLKSKATNSNTESREVTNG